jgi:hypothetical protein
MRVWRRKHIALHRGPASDPVGHRQHWSMDFSHIRLWTAVRFGFWRSSLTGVGTGRCCRRGFACRVRRSGKPSSKAWAKGQTRGPSQ